MSSTASNNLILDTNASTKNDYYSIITWAAELMWQLPDFENYTRLVDQSVCLFKTAAMHLLVRSLGTKLTYDCVTTVTTIMETSIKIIQDKRFTTCMFTTVTNLQCMSGNLSVS
jgi:hypothetical protein